MSQCTDMVGAAAAAHMLSAQRNNPPEMIMMFMYKTQPRRTKMLCDVSQCFSEDRHDSFKAWCHTVMLSLCDIVSVLHSRMWVN